MAKDNLLSDDLAKKVEPIEGVEDSISALLTSVAHNIEVNQDNPGGLRAYVESLRDGSDEVVSAVLANSPVQNKR